MIKRIDWRLTATFLGAIGIVAVLLLTGPRNSNAVGLSWSKIVRDIGQLKALDAQLTQEILLLKNGITWDYDSIESIMRATNFTVAALKLPKLNGHHQQAKDLRALLDNLNESLVQRVARVERFKSKNAIARNSSIYFTHLLIKTAKDIESFNFLDRDLKRLSNLRMLMLAYGLHRGPEVEKALKAILSDLRDSAALLDPRRASATRLLTQIANHGEVMISGNREVDGLVAELIGQQNAQLLELIDYEISVLLNI